MGPFWTRLEKCRFLPNGVSVEDFASVMDATDRRQLCERFGIPLDAIVVGHFGRMEKVKNQKVLLEAFSVLAKRDARYRLFIGGEGELREHLVSYAAQLGIADRVVMPGFCDNSVELYVHLFDVFCLPSLAEGFGNVLVEATAAGLFSVCSDTITKDLTSSFPERIKPVAIHSSPEVWADALEFGVAKKLPPMEGLQIVSASPFTLDAQLELLVGLYRNSVAART